MADPAAEIKEGLDLLAEEVRRYGGLPDPRDHPEFYARLLNLIDLAKEVGAKLSMAKLAEVLGVGYATLRKKVKEYKELELAGEDVGEAEIEEPALEPELQAVEEKPGEEKPEEKPKRRPRKSTKRTEEKIHEAAVKRLSKRAEDLVKEEVERIIELGSLIVERYQSLCYASGFEDLAECIEAAFAALTEVYPRLREVEEKYDACKESLKLALKLSNRYFAILYLLDEASKSIKSPEQLELIEALEEVLNE